MQLFDFGQRETLDGLSYKLADNVINLQASRTWSDDSKCKATALKVRRQNIGLMITHMRSSM